jgi:4-hydroxybenzoate polyprenyltransferase
MLLAAMGLMLLYNLYGKRFPLPLVSDAVQGLGWAALALYGALATGMPLHARAGWLCATILLYVMMVNGLHGGLRDLANDARHGARTTALFLGARATPEGELILSARIVLYGLTLHLLLLFLTVACILRNWPRDHWLSMQLLVTAVAAGHLLLLWLGRKALRAAASAPDLIRAGMLHLFLSIGIVCLPFAFFTNPFAAAVITGAYAVPPAILFLYLAWFSMRRRSRTSITEAG